MRGELFPGIKRKIVSRIVSSQDYYRWGIGSSRESKERTKNFSQHRRARAIVVVDGGSTTTSFRTFIDAGVAYTDVWMDGACIYI